MAEAAPGMQAESPTREWYQAPSKADINESSRMFSRPEVVAPRSLWQLVYGSRTCNPGSGRGAEAADSHQEKDQTTQDGESLGHTPQHPRLRSPAGFSRG